MATERLYVFNGEQLPADIISSVSTTLSQRLRGHYAMLGFESLGGSDFQVDVLTRGGVGRLSAQESDGVQTFGREYLRRDGRVVEEYIKLATGSKPRLTFGRNIWTNSPNTGWKKLSPEFVSVEDTNSVSAKESIERAVISTRFISLPSDALEDARYTDINTRIGNVIHTKTALPHPRFRDYLQDRYTQGETSIHEDLPLSESERMFWADWFLHTLYSINPPITKGRNRQVVLQQTSDRCGMILAVKPKNGSLKNPEETLIAGVAKIMGKYHPIVRFTSVVDNASLYGFPVTRVLSDCVNSRDAVGYGMSLLGKIQPDPTAVHQ